MMIERIRREHSYMTRLLAILSKKLYSLQNEQKINYSLVREIVDYLSSHSEAAHHPKEDLMYNYYIQNYGEKACIADLEADHKRLAEKTHAFLDVVDMILQDVIVPQDIFMDQLADFILVQKKHLEFEEREVLPLIDKTFTVDDWKVIESQWTYSEDDPVFGETIADRYKQLAQLLREERKEQS
ncbi:hemerythrin domain-containing protein [Vibrio quintilis]|nr:hemerythrin domain-containing protein [Vibrio quintilis]